jgi:hypothetical protein
VHGDHTVIVIVIVIVVCTQKDAAETPQCSATA